MTTLQHTLQLLEMCTEVYYRYMYYADYLPQSELNDHIGDVEKTKLIYDAKQTVLWDALRNQPRKRENAENAGIWAAQKRFYKEYPQFTPEWWKMDDLLKWKNETL